MRFVVYQEENLLERKRDRVLYKIIKSYESIHVCPSNTNAYT